MNRQAPDHEAGVSVIIGTLLLILITVTAAAGLAIMVSELQKDEMERQSHQAAVKSEQLVIHGIEPSYNTTTLERLNITVLNMNTDDSRVQLVGISDGTKDIYPANFTSGGVLYNNTNARLDIPAAKQGRIELNFTGNFTADPNITSDDPLRIWVITSYYNTFEKTFKAPVADFSFRIEKEDLGVTERDVVVLDGSASTDDGSIVNWTWIVEDGSVTVPVGNWSDTTNIRWPSVPPGKTSSFAPNTTGPFRINLTVIDDSSMKDTTDYKVIPQNMRFFPPTYLDAVFVSNATEGLYQIIATVMDLDHNPVQGTTVMFVDIQDVHGNLTLDRWSGTTDFSGNIIVNVTEGAGTIRVSSGKIPARDVPVST